MNRFSLFDFNALHFPTPLNISLSNKSLWSQRMLTPYLVVPGLGTMHIISSVLVEFSIKRYVYPYLGSEFANWLLRICILCANSWENICQVSSTMHGTLWCRVKIQYMHESCVRTGYWTSAANIVKTMFFFNTMGDSL